MQRMRRLQVYVSTGDIATTARKVKALVFVSRGGDAPNARNAEAPASASTGDNAEDARLVKWLSLHVLDESLRRILQRKRNNYLAQRMIPPRTSVYTALTGQATRTSGHELGRGTLLACDQPTS